jgi:hypothetical protein
MIVRSQPCRKVNFPWSGGWVSLLGAVILSALLYASPAAARPPSYFESPGDSFSAGTRAIEREKPDKIRVVEPPKVDLPNGLSADGVFEALGISSKIKTSTKRVFVKMASAWPLIEDTVVTVVAICDAPDAEECENEKKSVMIGVFEGSKDRADTWQLVAKTPTPIRLKGSVCPKRGFGQGGSVMRCEGVPPFATCVDCEDKILQRFVFAPFSIRKGEYAFGIVSRLTETYHTGSARYDMLRLFRIDGREVVQVLAVPMHTSKEIGMSWDDDTDTANGVKKQEWSATVGIRRASHYDYFDVLAKDADGHRISFEWDAERRAYRAIPEELPVVTDASGEKTVLTDEAQASPESTPESIEQ